MGVRRRPGFKPRTTVAHSLRWAITLSRRFLVPQWHEFAGLTVVPQSGDGLRRAIGEAHRRYTRRVNFREGWRGHLWQGRFASYVMDEPHVLAAARYAEWNPVRARLVQRPEDYRWSSAPAHLCGQDDELVKIEPLLALVNDWQDFLATDVPPEQVALLRRHERTGRPLGDAGFIGRLEQTMGRLLRKQRPGPAAQERR